MNIIKLSVDFLGVICEVIIMRYFFTYLLKKSSLTKTMALVFYSVCCVFLTFATLVPNNHIVLPVLNFVVVCAVSLTFKGKLHTKFFMSCVLMIMFILSEEIIGAVIMIIMRIELDKIHEDILLYTIALLASKLLIFIIVKILGFRKAGLYKNIPYKVFLGLMLTPLSSIIAMYTLGINFARYEDQRMKIAVIITTALMLVANFFVFYLFENQIKAEQTKATLAFVERQMNQQTEYYKELSIQQTEIRKLSHDMKNYLSGVLGFIQNGDTDEAIQYLKKIESNLMDSVSAFDTGYPAIDTLLHYKKHSADALNILFIASVALPEQVSVDVLDLCIVLGNSLDNAIEACEKIVETDKRFIHLSVAIHSKYILIKVENSTEKKDLSEYPLKSTKENTLYHGIGLESMTAIASRYDGSLTAECKDFTFSLSVLMKNG